jgi:hypothetical protein
MHPHSRVQLITAQVGTASSERELAKRLELPDGS